MTVTVCIIAHNEEETLPGTLSSLSWADEIVVVDCESGDGTAAVAAKHTKNIFTRPNIANLNVNKNFSFDQAKSEWILCLDADESVPEALAAEIRRVTEGDPPETAFFLRRRNSWFGRVLKHGGHFPDKQLRLFRRGKGRFPEKHVHERLRVEGRVGTLSTPLDHLSYRSVDHYLRKMNFYTSFEAQRLFDAGKRFTIEGFFVELASAAFRFFRRYFLQRGFLDGWQGYAAANLDFITRIVIQVKLKDKTTRSERMSGTGRKE